MHVLPSEQEMFTALLRRDSMYEGVFVVGVKTTSVFCRPTCPARKPKRENVEFFPNAGAALRAGYRACLRCQPLELPGSTPEWAQRLLDQVDATPGVKRSDADLRAMRIDPARARRFFRSRFGMTFHDYQRSRRMGAALAEVRGGASISRATMRSGFHSDSGFREAFVRTFGEPPARSAALTCLLAKWLTTPLGPMLALANDEGVHLLEFVDRRGLERELEVLRRRLDCAIVPGTHEHLESIERELREYYDGTLQRFTTPVVFHGSPFQQSVWKRLMQIPYGATDTYAQMASDLGRAGASRAVGRANGQNILAIIVPCHRVIRSDGTLCGYGGGIWRKKRLIEHERASASIDVRS